MPEANNKPAHHSNGAWRGAVVLVMLLAMAAGLRFAVIAARWERLTYDPDAYRLIAENLRTQGVYSRSPAGAAVEPTAFRPPLYPLLLAALARQGEVTPGAVATLHLVLGTLSVLLAWLLAQKWELGRWSYLVAIVVACDPILLNQSAEVMTETLATFMALGSLLALTHLSNVRSWKASLLAGSVLGLATLCRPTFLIWSALVIAWVVTFWPRWMGTQRAVVMLAGFLSILAPWVIRNQQVMGRAILATTHGGYTLLLGNNPPFYRHLRSGTWGSVWDAQQLLPLLEAAAQADATTARENTARENTAQENTAQENTAQENTAQENTAQENTGQGGVEHQELAEDRRLYALAWETVRQEPTMFAYACLVRVSRFWTPLPHRLSNDESLRGAAARWGVAVWYVGVFLVALVGLWQLGRRAVAPPWVWGLLCVLALTAVHTVYWSNMRMRAPAMPIVYVVFALGCRGLYEQFWRRRVTRDAARGVATR